MNPITVSCYAPLAVTEGPLVSATVALVVVTALLAAFTAWLVFETRNGTKRQLGMQVWLALIARFDSEEMKQARKSLALQLDCYDIYSHDAIEETVMDFFEDVGIAYKHGYLDNKLAVSSFSYYANYWWAATEEYINRERQFKGGDTSIFAAFEDFASAMHAEDPVVTSAAVKQFLDEEKRANV